MSGQLCYCYGYTEADIEADMIKNNGKSSILEKIAYNQKNSLCQCELNHPEKRPCLSDVTRVVEKIKNSLFIADKPCC
jgi:hypothetical protein